VFICFAAGDSSARKGGATAIPAVSDRDSDTASTDLSARMQVQSGAEGAWDPHVLPCFCVPLPTDVMDHTLAVCC
jgi:hypothetical protein